MKLAALLFLLAACGTPLPPGPPTIGACKAQHDPLPVGFACYETVCDYCLAHRLGGTMVPAYIVRGWVCDPPEDVKDCAVDCSGCGP